MVQEDPYFDYGDGNQTVTFFEQASGTVFDVNVSDFENSPITYGLTGNGPDDANFSINPNTERSLLNPFLIMNRPGVVQIQIEPILTFWKLMQRMM